MISRFAWQGPHATRKSFSIYPSNVDRGADKMSVKWVQRSGKIARFKFLKTNPCELIGLSTGRIYGTKLHYVMHGAAGFTLIFRLLFHTSHRDGWQQGRNSSVRGA